MAPAHALRDLSGSAQNADYFKHYEPRKQGDEAAQSPRRFAKVDDEHDEHLTPRHVMAGIESFSLMMKHGAKLGDALKAALTGRCMTEPQAATCIQTFWRRYQCIVAAETGVAAAQIIQHAYRMAQWQRVCDAAAVSLQAAQRGAVARRQTSRQLSQFRACRTLQNAWRQRRARQLLARLKRGKGGIKRSFSWTKRTKKPRGERAVRREDCGREDGGRAARRQGTPMDRAADAAATALDGLR